MKTLREFITESGGQFKIPAKMLENVQKAIDAYKENGGSAPTIKANNSTIQKMVWAGISILGKEADLNFIDTSGVTSMEWLFDEQLFKLHHGEFREYETSGIGTRSDIHVALDKYKGFDGDISKWDVSNVTNMNRMFCCASYTGKHGGISNWDVSNVTDMSSMFRGKSYDEYNYNKFNGDISRWNVSKVKTMTHMFEFSNFNRNISGWDVSSVKDMKDMFIGSKLRDNGNLPSWYNDWVDKHPDN